jgi:hypothetical protein
MQSIAIAQSDTTYFYLGKTGATTKDSAHTYIKFYRDGDAWYGKAYDSKTDRLSSEGHYKEVNYKTPIRTFKNYAADGNLEDVATYNDESKIQERTYYWKDGKKKGLIHYIPNGANEQKCWDSTGKEIKPCVLEVEASFPGGQSAWVKFLERNLNANVAADSGAPEGMYTVTAQFVVDKNGRLANIKATDIPKLCIPCGREVERILRMSPDWVPAVQGGRPVFYQAIQKVSFQVIEERRRRRRD